MKYNKGDIIPFEQTKEATDWVNSVEGNYYLEDYMPDDNGNMQLIVRQLPEPTPEELAYIKLAQAKAERAEAVSNITIEVDGMVFDGDETSQTRMGRSIVAMNDNETITWVLHDDTIAQVSKAQLKEVLRKAGQKQTELWTVPYL